MSTDARSLSDGAVLTGDVCIVGAGPAGITLARTLASAGIEVLLLEGGGVGVTREARDLARGESVGESYFPLETTRAFGFGGTTALWIPGLFRTAPLSPLDFERRPEVPYSGWPISRQQLDPFYERALPLCGLSRFDFSAAAWETEAEPALPLPADLVETLVFQSAPHDIWVRRYDEVRRTPNLRLVLNAHVVELCTGGEGDRLDRLRLRTTTGIGLEARGRVTVLAAGGIENARLLLLSRDRHANGIGNEHDLVGRFFQDHLALRGGVLRLADPFSPDRMGLYFMHFGRDDARIQAKISTAEAVVRSRGMLGCAFFVTKVDEDRASETARSLAMIKRRMRWRPAPTGLARHVARVARNAPTAARLALNGLRGAQQRPVLQLLSEAEQAPNPSSRVSLSPGRVDLLGRPVARLDWRTSEQDRKSIVEAQGILDGALRAQGIGCIESPVTMERPDTGFAGHWHHMGTTRMSDDSRTGVVDKDARVHGMKNLFVAGSSVFPTGGYANPQLTIVALALRLAEHIREILPTLPW